MGSFRFPRSIAAVSLCLSAGLLIAAPAVAQDQDQAPAHLAFVDGAALLDREGQTEPATVGVPFVPGDRIRTDRGRVEIVFPDGSAIDVDQFTSVDLASPALLRVTTGRVLLTVAGSSNPSAAVRYQIDTPVASAVTDGPGEYRVSLLTGAADLETELAVRRGFAVLSTERGSMNVRAGERSVARDQESPMYPQIFNSARFDAFDRWAEARRFDRSGATSTAQYLPSDLRMYGSTFDRNGAWQYESSYGYVWYPSVAFDWRPYYNGYWSSIRPYGWTWIGLDAWSWPTHHYGRWGHARNQWFWIPGRRWASAWVSWGAAPGYVSWCPLGFDNRPVFGLTAVGEPWAGWVVIPRTHFGGYRVSQWAVAPHRLQRNTPFATLAGSPVPPPRTYAVPRAVVTDGGSVGTFAVPRRASAGGPSPVAGNPGTPVDRRQPAAATTQSRAPLNGSRRPDRDPPTASVTRQPYAGATPLPIDRSAGSAIRRQPSADNRLETPGAAAPASADRSNPRLRQPLGSEPYRQPLPQVPALPRSRPLPQASPGYQTSPGQPVWRGSAPTQDQPPQPYRQASPRWSLPGGALATPPPPARSSGQPAGVAPSQAPPQSAPRREGYSRAPAPSAPPPEAARPAPPSRSPGMAVQRSAPSPSAAPSAPAAASPPPARSHDGGGGGARQRRPS